MIIKEGDFYEAFRAQSTAQQFTIIMDLIYIMKGKTLRDEINAMDCRASLRLIKKLLNGRKPNKETCNAIMNIIDDTMEVKPTKVYEWQNDGVFEPYIEFEIVKDDEEEGEHEPQV